MDTQDGVVNIKVNEIHETNNLRRKRMYTDIKAMKNE